MCLKNQPGFRLTIGVILGMLVLLNSCNIPFITGSTDSSVKQTLQAISVSQTVQSLQRTQAALKQQGIETTPVPGEVDQPGGQEYPKAPTQPFVEPPENQPTPTVQHFTFPSEPPKAASALTDTSSHTTAPLKRAPGGDDYAHNLLERPFTPNEMDYVPELDVQKAELGVDDLFFYVTIHLRNLSPEKTLAGAYAIEIDINRDGRGDFIAWAVPLQDEQGVLYHPLEWSTQKVLAFRDANFDVGKEHPLFIDPPEMPGDGYETQVFDGDAPVDDPDIAWQRVNPADPLSIQIAFKRETIGSPDSFMWGVYADLGLVRPDLMDYNDSFTIPDAGSPLIGPNYPCKAVNKVDNTCRAAWGFKPVGNEPGLCKSSPSRTPTPVKTRPVLYYTPYTPYYQATTPYYVRTYEITPYPTITYIRTYFIPTYPTPQMRTPYPTTEIKTPAYPTRQVKTPAYPTFSVQTPGTAPTFYIPPIILTFVYPTIEPPR